MPAVNAMPARAKHLPNEVRTEAPDRATQEMLRVLAEEIDELRAELQKVRDEVGILRTLVSQRGVRGSYRGVDES